MLADRLTEWKEKAYFVDVRCCIWDTNIFSSFLFPPPLLFASLELPDRTNPSAISPEFLPLPSPALISFSFSFYPFTPCRDVDRGLDREGKVERSVRCGSFIF